MYGLLNPFNCMKKYSFGQCLLIVNIISSTKRPYYCPIVDKKTKYLKMVETLYLMVLMTMIKEVIKSAFYKNQMKLTAAWQWIYHGWFTDSWYTFSLLLIQPSNWKTALEVEKQRENTITICKKKEVAVSCSTNFEILKAGRNI